jgi:tetratricopeptide (TPR) repeat protein
MRFLDAMRGTVALALLITCASVSLAQSGATIVSRPQPAAKPAPSSGRPKSFAVLNEKLRVQVGLSDSEMKKKITKASKDTGLTTVPGPEIPLGAGLGGFPSRGAPGAGAQGGEGGQESLADKLRRQGLTDQEIEALAAMGVVANPYGPGGPGGPGGPDRMGGPDGMGGPGGEGGDQPPKEMQVPSFPPDSTQKLLIVGDLAFRRGLYARAQSAYERALAMEPESAACQLAIAEVAYATGQYERASETVYTVLRRGPSTLRTMIERNGLYPNPAAIDRALAELTKHVNGHSDNAKEMMLYAYVLVSTDGSNPKTTLEALQRASTLVGTDDPALRALATRLAGKS